MSLQPASLGRFWLGPQVSGKGTPATTFYGMKANLVDVAPAQMFRNVGQMVGSNLLPGGSIKTAAWSGGAVVMPPPLDDYIGWLLYAFAGSVSTVTNGDSTYSHFFPAAADSVAPGKYLTARRKVPGSSVLYEQMEDQVVYRLLLGVTPGEYATLRAEMVGRTPTSPDGSGWTYDSKDETSVPIACKGSFELPDGAAVETSTAVTLDFTNIIPDMGRVLTVGSYYPFDFPVLGRAITVSFSHLWENKTLYESLYYDTGVWTPEIYSSSLDVTIQSPGYAVGTTPYELKFYGQNVDWSCQPVRLAGGDLVEMAMSGVVAASASGFDWYLALKNITTTYDWT